MNILQNHIDRVKAIRCFVCDVDGVLTDGRLYYGPEGETLKVFHVQDGLGLRMLMHHGFEVGIISGRSCQALQHRLKELGLRHSYLGFQDKNIAFDGLMASLAIPPEAIAYMGDDLNDLAVLGRAGLALAPANAHPVVRERCHAVTQANGGNAAVREACDAFLQLHQIKMDRWEGKQ